MKVLAYTEQDIRLVRRSGLVNQKWYCETYPDVPASGMDPVVHYLKYGWLMGRNPCRRFDTRHYLEANPDIVSGGINPLLHYIKNRGQGAGKAADDDRSPLERDIRERLAPHLWGGHSDSAMEELDRIRRGCGPALAEVRGLAAWHCARWLFFVEQYEKALLLIEEEQYSENSVGARKSFVCLHTYCLLRLGKEVKAKEILENFIDKNPQDPDASLILSNLYKNDDDMRLALINGVLEKAGLVPVRKIDKLLPLALTNVKGDALPYQEAMPKVSVVMPIFNAEATIEMAIRGLLDQSWRNLEVIAVDDCSVDGTFGKIVELSKIDSRIIPFRQPSNAGAYAARNRGLELATGDFITTHDSDDWSHPQKIETQVKFLLEHEKVMGVVGYWVRVLPTLEFSPNWRVSGDIIHWSHSSFLFRRKVIEEIGSWDNVMVGGDTEFIWRVEKRYGAWAVKKVGKGVPLSFSLDDERSLTRTKATHVKTIHFGLRHIYRASCQWWHANADKLRLTIGGERPFPVPRAMLSRSRAHIDLEVLVISDFSVGDENLDIFCELGKRTYGVGRVGFFHWPRFVSRPGPLQDGYFECISNGVEPIVAGQAVRARRLVALDPLAVSTMLDSGPCFVKKPEVYEIPGIPKNDPDRRAELLGRLMMFVSRNLHESMDPETTIGQPTA